MSGTRACRMSWNCWWTSRSSMMKTFFQQACPICGRTVRIEKSLRFSPVVCQHCGGDFPANDQSRVVHSNTILPVSQAEKIDALLWKSDQALRLGKVSHCWNHEATFSRWYCVGISMRSPSRWRPPCISSNAFLEASYQQKIPSAEDASFRMT